MQNRDGPIVVIPVFDLPGRKERTVAARFLISSLTRSMFSGRVIVFRTMENVIFKLPKPEVEERMIHSNFYLSGEMNRKYLEWQMFDRIPQELDILPDQWIIFMDPFSLAIRNIDHLFPDARKGLFPAPVIDVLWLSPDASRRHPVTESEPFPDPGVFAIKARHLELFSSLWKEENHAAGRMPQMPPMAWYRALERSALKKKGFERGEVFRPSDESLHWRNVTESALITLPSWEDEIRGKLQQSLYYGTYLGDSSGLYLQLIEP